MIDHVCYVSRADWVHRINHSKKSHNLNFSGLGIQECPFAPYKPVLVLDYSRNRIESINEEVLVMATLTDVNLSNNRILKIPHDINRLMKCTKLNLTQNKIDVMPESLGRMSSLTALSIIANRIEDIHPGISLCSTLKDLRLSGNRIRMIPLEMCVMSQLAVLHLKDNAFGPTMFEVIETFSIPKLLDFLKQLRESAESQVLNLSERQLHDVPGVIQQCHGLKKLDFSKNVCKHISTFIGLLIHLTDLNLRGNVLKDVPVEIGAINGLKLFDLGENRLKDVPDACRSLHQLTFLWLDKNKIKDIPPWFAELECLTYANFDFNSVETIDKSIGKLQPCRQLLLRSNNFLQFPEYICDLTKLEELNLNSNIRLFVMPGALLQMQSLQVLQMDDCGLLRLHDSIGYCTSLRFLSLSGNNIAMIPVSFSSLMKLEILNLSSNKIVFFPPVCHMTKLLQMNLSSNEITTLSLEMGDLVGMEVRE